MTDLIAGIFVLIVLALISAVALLDLSRSNVTMELLDMKLDSIKIFKEADKEIRKKAPKDLELIALENKAEMLRFCYLCPLYQEKVQEGKQQKTPQERE